ncbi:MAG: S8 family serine peptidase [Clostridioides sp.]|jgi:hypothetical protein|nr:S8 family serine peptidase [Clostridioides sp.]
MSILIIDSGINKEFKEFRNKNIKGININTYGTDMIDLKDDSGHGTSCSAEIFRVNNNIKLNVVKVLNKDSKTSVKKLVESIEYAAEQKDIKIVSMSCSTLNDEYENEMKKVVEYANWKNKLLICSSDNTNSRSLPSYLKGVIGVQRTNIDIKPYLFNKNKEIQCLCKYNYRLLPCKNEKYRMFGGNSYSTAYFSGYISTLFEDISISNDELINLICKNSDVNKQIENKVYKDSINEENIFKKEFMNKNKYNLIKLKILVDLIIEFRNLIQNKKISKKEELKISNEAIYLIIGIENVYDFIKFLEIRLKIHITYNEVTYNNLESIYSLYDFVF